MNPSTAQSLVVSGFTLATMAGVASHAFTVTADDAYGNVATGYTGTVALTSSDGQVVFGGTPYTFTSGTGLDAGTHTFKRRAEDGGGAVAHGWRRMRRNSLTGSETGIVVTANTAATVVVSGFTATTTAGVAHNFKVTVEDIYGNIATGFTGTVTLTSSDTFASFDAPLYTFTTGTGADDGAHTFSGILQKAGAQSIAAASAGLTSTQPRRASWSIRTRLRASS